MRQIFLFTVVNAILLIGKITSINAQGLRGRLLTPQEGCGYSKVLNTKIVGGTPAKPDAFPWIAAIAYKKDDGSISFHCSGSLITSRHVLTAAHCIKSHMIGVRLGAVDINSPPPGSYLDVKVIRSVKHAAWSNVEIGDGTNDIGILTLEHDVDFNDRIHPICLPLTDEAKRLALETYTPFAAGWGDLSEGGPPSNVLIQVQITVISNAECEAMYRADKHYRMRFGHNVLCAGNVAGGQGTCHGDSGGPLMLPTRVNNEFPMYQIGVVAYGMGCGRPYLPGVFSRVSYFMDWIQQNIN